MRSLTSEQKVHYTLRLAVAMCFIGHGAFGIITKPIWCNYFAVFGIGHDLAYRLMPVLGSFDILLGFIMLVYPMRIIPLWLVIWGVLTATLRPLSGEPFAELIERAGNFGAPLAFLILSGSGGKGIGGWIARVHPNSGWTAGEGQPEDQLSASEKINGATLIKLILVLRIVVFLLLLGHGWLNIVQKKGLLGQYASLGVSAPGTVALYVGLFEIVAACAVLVRPLRPVLLGLLVWKMASELFYPHWEVFEWVERAGSYGSILALWFATREVSLDRERYVTLAT